MKSLAPFIGSLIILSLLSCARPQPANIVLARSAAEINPTTSGCNPTAYTGPYPEEHYFPVKEPLSRFVRRIHEDRYGSLWFGTNGDGVIRYKDDSLTYFGMKDGFAGMAVRAIVEDKVGNLWFGTENGLRRYHPDRPGHFSNYSVEDGLIHNDIWSLSIDNKGLIWVGTLEGISVFNGKSFTPFALPETEPDNAHGVTSARIVHSILQDSQGRMWFGSNGGAFIYDGQSLRNISTREGLCHNTVNDILEDRAGNFWFATHHQGVCRWDGESFTHFNQTEGVKGEEVWSLFEDSQGNIWFPAEGYGIYRYDGKSFGNWHSGDGLPSDAIQCSFEDSQGRLWLGGYLGLFRLEGDRFIVIGKKGPWQAGC